MAGINGENNFYNPFQEVNHKMKLLNHEMGNLSVLEYTDKFQELAQLMPRERTPGLMLTRFVQGLAPQSGEGQEDKRSESRRSVRKKRKQSELDEPEEGK
ncbi:hypothetical protein L1987_02221 [Smallanthus sonchifolius]|uniref:Uncharacterized protein n=1 Tax=Smallanthus sonchifolius TaxID=185202 RepID=A0ACB9K7D5_9ASTR|nr:hypothetical protein L1987_02221 [Smallanthus sonchifolius]